MVVGRFYINDGPDAGMGNAIIAVVRAKILFRSGMEAANNTKRSRESESPRESAGSDRAPPPKKVELEGGGTPSARGSRNTSPEAETTASTSASTKSSIQQIELNFSVYDWSTISKSSVWPSYPVPAKRDPDRPSVVHLFDYTTFLASDNSTPEQPFQRRIRHKRRASPAYSSDMADYLHSRYPDVRRITLRFKMINSRLAPLEQQDIEVTLAKFVFCFGSCEFRIFVSLGRGSVLEDDDAESRQRQVGNWFVDSLRSMGTALYSHEGVMKDGSAETWGAENPFQVVVFPVTVLRDLNQMSNE